MSATLLLRIASGLTFLHAVLHTVGGVFGKPEPGAQQSVAAIMKATSFPVMGLTRTYWDFYQGMGLAVSVFLTIEAFVFWQLATMARTGGAQIRPLLITFLIGYLCFAAVSCLYFFAPPVITELLIALCVGLALRAV